MLVLSRKTDEEIRIGDGIVVRVLRVSGSTVKLGIEAPLETPILRGELQLQLQQERAEREQQLSAERSEQPVSAVPSASSLPHAVTAGG